MMAMLFLFILQISTEGEREKKETHGGMLNLFQGKKVKGVYGMSFYTRGWTVSGWHDDNVRQAGEWIKDNVPAGESIMCDWFWKESIYFYSRGCCPFYSIPFTYLPDGVTGAMDEKSFKRLPTPEQSFQERPLFLLSVLNKINPETSLVFLNQEELLDNIKQHNICYVIVTWRRNFLSKYFEANPGFKKVRQFGKGQIKIYKVEEPALMQDLKLYVGSNLPKYFRKKRRIDKESFKVYCKETLKKRLNLSDEMIGNMLNKKKADIQNTYITVEFYKVDESAE